MTARASFFIGLIVAFAAHTAPAQELLSRPEVPGYDTPASAYPVPASEEYEYVYVAALAAGLVLASYFALATRSRRALFWLAVASLLCFGFWRHGCVCSIGAIQNVARAMGDPAYALPWTVVAFFALPILFTLLFGRTFCAAVCPLGAIQEMVVVRPVKVPDWLDHGLAPSALCVPGNRRDLRGYRDGIRDLRVRSVHRDVPPRHQLGEHVRFRSLFSGRRPVRGPALLPVSLPLWSDPRALFPGLEKARSDSAGRVHQVQAVRGLVPLWSHPRANHRPAAGGSGAGRRRLATMLCLLPLLVVLGGALGYLLATPLSQLHPTVWRAEYVRLDDQAGSQRKAAEEANADRRQADVIKYRNDVVQSFHNSGRPPQELYDEASALRREFARAGALVGHLGWAGGRREVDPSEYPPPPHGV